MLLLLGGSTLVSLPLAPKKVAASDRGTIRSCMSGSEHQEDVGGVLFYCRDLHLCSSLGRHNLNPRPQSIHGQSSALLHIVAPPRTDHSAP